MKQSLPPPLPPPLPQFTPKPGSLHGSRFTWNDIKSSKNIRVAILFVIITLGASYFVIKSAVYQALRDDREEEEIERGVGDMIRETGKHRHDEMDLYHKVEKRFHELTD